MFVRVLYCVVWRCSYGWAVYCVVRAAYCVLVRCTVWQGGVMCGRACIVC